MESSIQLHPSWLEVLSDAFAQPSFKELKQFLVSEKRAGKIIYPPGKEIFAALNQTPFDKVKIVILGQDPYHGPGQANGMCFSVKKGIALPPSLKNIYKELASDLQIPLPNNGDLTPWANQGVLLLNAVLTVEANLAASHQNKGWEPFTDAIIKALNEKANHLVFILWGGFARSKKSLINTSKHLVLEAAHPSPLSAYNGFFGCNHFSKANHYLVSNGVKPVDWQLTDI